MKTHCKLAALGI